MYNASSTPLSFNVFSNRKRKLTGQHFPPFLGVALPAASQNSTTWVASNKTATHFAVLTVPISSFRFPIQVLLTELDLFYGLALSIIRGHHATG